MGVRRFPRYSAKAIRGPRWKALRMATLRRDGFRCVKCGSSGHLEVDHIKPVRTHPELAHDPENLQALCGRCHSQKTRIEAGFPPPCEKRAAWRVAVAALAAKPNREGTKHA